MPEDETRRLLVEFNVTSEKQEALSKIMARGSEVIPELVRLLNDTELRPTCMSLLNLHFGKEMFIDETINQALHEAIMSIEPETGEYLLGKLNMSDHNINVITSLIIMRTQVIRTEKLVGGIENPEKAETICAMLETRSNLREELLEFRTRLTDIAQNGSSVSKQMARRLLNKISASS